MPTKNLGYPRKLLLIAILAGGGASLPATGGPIVFDFEAPPISDDGNGINPIFSENGFQMRYINPERNGVAQWTNDARSIPRTGTGSLRLSGGSANNTVREGKAIFSTPAREVQLELANITSPIDSIIPANVIAMGADGEVLQTKEIPAAGTFEAPEWTLLTFANKEDIHGLVFVGIVLKVYWDNMTITPVPEPGTITIVALLALGAYGFRSTKLVGGGSYREVT